MASLNKVQLIGHIGQPAEMRTTPTGIPVASVNVATSSTYTNGHNQRITETEWHRVTFFNKLAEVVQKYTTTGSLIYLEGRLKTDKWEDQNGQTRYSTQIIADRLQLLDRPQK